MMLFLKPIEVILIAFFAITTVIYALVLAGKKETNTRFLTWGLFILIAPFIGALSYIVYYYKTRKE
jgi:hypothetical protein